MKKKLLSLLLVLTMVCALSVPSFAASAGMSNFMAKEKYNPSTFGDVPSGAWYANSVQLCYEYGLMGGKGAGKFDPDGAMTLAEAVVMADRVHEIYTSGDSTLANGSPWYKPYVDYAAANGIVKDGEFKDYSAKATRAQMAYIFASALPSTELVAMNDITAIPDVNSDDKYGAEIYMLYNAGVLTGNDKYGTFAPASNVSRCAAAAIISRVALPTQRQGVLLYKDFTKDAVHFVMPVDTEYARTSGTDLYISNNERAGGANTGIYTNVNAVFSGYSIQDILTNNEMKVQLQEQLKESGMEATITGNETVKFGTVTAYRYEISLSPDDINSAEYAYCFMRGSTLYTVCIASCNPSVLKTMDNSLTVGGCRAK